MTLRTVSIVASLALLGPWLGEDRKQTKAVADPSARAVESALAVPMPANSLAYAEVERPADLWQRIQGAGIPKRVRELRGFQAAMKGSSGLQILASLVAARAALGMDFEPALGKLAGRGVALAAIPAPPGSKKRVHLLLAIRAEDAALLVRTRDAIAETFGAVALGEWLPDRATAATRKTARFGEVVVVSAGEGFHHAIAGEWLLASDSREILEGAVGRLDSGNDGLASRPAFAAARSSRAAGSLGFFWTDMEAVKVARPQLSSGEPEMEPLPALLVGGFREAFFRSPWLAGSLTARDGEFSLSLATAAKPASASAAFLPRQVPVPEIVVPRQIGSLVMRRDVESFWRDHEGVVAAEFDASFAKFNSVAGAIFGVRRLDEDVLPHLEPVAQWVVARQTYESLSAAPKIQIPAFAMILQGKGSNKKVGEGFRRAFQTSMALAGADQAQKEKMALGLDEETCEGVRITVATYPESERKGPLETEYNFSPAFFTKGPFVVFSSTRELARDLAKAIPESWDPGAGSATRPAERILDAFELRGAESRLVLRKNLDALVSQQVLEKGKTKEEAERELRDFLDLLSLVSGARAEVRESPSGLDLRLRLDLLKSK